MALLNTLKTTSESLITILHLNFRHHKVELISIQQTFHHETLYRYQ